MFYHIVSYLLTRSLFIIRAFFSPSVMAETDSADAPATRTICEYCDVETQQAIADRLLHAVATRATKCKLSTDDAVRQVREKLLPASGKPSLATLHAAFEQLDGVKAKGLNFFVAKEEMQRRVSVAERDMDLGMDFRRAVRERLSLELIREYDVSGEHHCGAVTESDSPTSAEAAERHRLACIFRPFACRNEGCVAMHSAKREGSHDAVCAYKMLPCVLGCPVLVQRRGMDEHADGPCANKPVDCPFGMLGCAEPCTQGGLQAHLKEEVTAHLGLCLAVMTTQQTQINALQATTAAAATAVADLAALHARVAALEAGAEDMKLAVRQSEQELRQALKASSEAGAAQTTKEVKEARKAATAVDKENRAALQKHAAAHDALAKQVEAVIARLGATGR